MDKLSLAHLDAQLRQAALAQAALDYKGGQSATDTVHRAKTYYEFLKGALNP
jgi:hypothetical protein